ncbi:MAG: hypothetical protein NT141_00755 [candidate division WWE3 bacterium]|nr:hypothetical protein [candidate division WWE3 bacterium]
MLLSIQFHSHFAVALYIKKNYNFDVIKVPLPFAFCQAEAPRKLLEVLNTVAEFTGDPEVLNYPSQNKLVIVDETIFTKMRSVLGFNVLYLSEDFSEILPLPEISNLLPFTINLTELSNIRASQSLIGSFLPVTPRDMLLQMAISKTIIRQLGYFKKTLPEELLLSGTVFSYIDDPAMAVEIFLDGVDAVGACFLLQDRIGIVPAMTAASLKVVTGDFIKLGSVVIWPGPATFELFFEGETLPQKLSLEEGRLARFSVPANTSVRVTGHGPKGDFDAELLGGALGIVIDTRMRPRIFPKTDEVRIKLLKEWSKALKS